MKIFVLITCFVCGLLFARTGNDSKNLTKNLNPNNKHYLIEDFSDKNNDKLDRKRTHKRRRKIRKPVKGLR